MGGGCEAQMFGGDRVCLLAAVDCVHSDVKTLSEVSDQEREVKLSWPQPVVIE